MPRGLLPIILVFAGWLVLRPVMVGVLRAAGVPGWVLMAIFYAGILAIIAWLVRWMYSRAAPARERLARGRHEHPGAEVWLVALDGEWNPIAESVSTVLVADSERLVIEGALDAAAADVVSVDTTFARSHALSIVVGDTTWTAVVAGGRWGSTGDRVITEGAAEAIRAALGLEVLDDVLDGSDELPHV